MRTLPVNTLVWFAPDYTGMNPDGSFEVVADGLVGWVSGSACRIADPEELEPLTYV